MRLNGHPRTTGVGEAALAGARGLKGHEIPLGARIIAVCDAFDAMMTERPDTRALTSEEARRELLRCAGTQYDPDVFEAFIEVHAEIRADLVA